MLLHRSTSTNGRAKCQPMILPIWSRGTQSNPWLSMVCSHAAQDRLETRVDRPHTTAHCPQSRQHKKSPLYPPNLQYPSTNLQGSVLYRIGHIQASRKNDRTDTRTTRRISKTLKDLQWTRISKTPRPHHLGSCNRTTPRCTYHITRMTPSLNPGRDWRSKEICRRTPEERNDLTIMEPLCH